MMRSFPSSLSSAPPVTCWPALPCSPGQAAQNRSQSVLSAA